MKQKITFFKNAILLITVFMSGGFFAFAQTPTLDYSFDGGLTGIPSVLTPLGAYAGGSTYEADEDSNANSALTLSGAAVGDHYTSTYTGVGAGGARTIMAWVKTSEAGSTRNTIVSYGPGTGAGKGMHLMISAGEIRLEGGSSNVRTSSAGLNDGMWHHVAVSFAGSPTVTTLNQFKLYVDGSEVAIGGQYNGTSVINTTTGGVRIGSANYGAHYFRSGAINDVKIYDTELTTAEIITAAGIVVGSPPVASFSASNTIPTVDEIITFTDASTNTPTSYTWDFGAVDAIGDTSAQSPQVSYQSVGTYNVTLTATNAAGTDDEVKTSYITVGASSGSGDLQAHYNFDNAITDASSYGRNLVAQGAFTPAYEADHSSNTSSALTASGTYADHLITGYGGITGNNSRTITAWFKTAGTSREPIVSFGENSSGKMFNVMINNGGPRLEAGASSLETTDSGLNDDNWHHIAVTYDSAVGTFLANCKIYIDGELSTNEADAGLSYNSETTVIDTDTTTNFFKIGSSIYSTYTFHGGLDDVRIYSKTLTATEVTTVMNGGILGVKDIVFGANELKVYPNQVKDILTIQTNISKKVTIKIYSLLGKLVINSNTKEVNMSDLSSGLYIVKIRAGAKVANLKIIKE